MILLDQRTLSIVKYVSKKKSSIHLTDLFKRHSLNLLHMNLKKTGQNPSSPWNHLCIESPKQNNNDDCGVFLLKNVELIAQNNPLNFNQKDIPEIRKQMLYKILGGRFS